MNFVEKHSKLLAVALCLCASGPILSTVHAYEVQPGWHQDGDTSYYVLANHTKAKGLTEIEDEKYYFDQSGKTVSGWQNVDNQIYYFDNNGKAVTGKTEIQGTAYNFGTTGTLSQGWEEDTYYNEKGFKVTSDLVSDDAGKYYVDETGSKVTDTWQKVNDDWYYFDTEGQSVAGQVDTEEGTFYTNADGVYRTGWFTGSHGTQYYLQDGSVNMEPYLEIEGLLYAFDENGYLLTNTEKDGYVINDKGVATVIEEQPVVDTPAAEQPAPEETPAEETVTDPVEEETVIEPSEEEVVENEVVQEPVQNAPAAPESEETYVEDLPEDPAPVEPEVNIPTFSEPVVDDYFYYDEPIYPENLEVIPEDITTVPGGDQGADFDQNDNFDQGSEYIPDDSFVQEIPEEDIIYEDITEEVMQPVADTSKASAIAAAALAQVGATQDCTMLVTNALAAVGINFHGWPADYASLGTWTSNPVPGDIIIYSGHVAVYIGNGQAVHGGFNGANTVVWSVNCANALIGYIHVA